MFTERNGTLPANSTRTLPHHTHTNSPRQSPLHHHTMPHPPKTYSPHHQPHHHHHPLQQHQSPKHPVPVVPTTSSGVPAQGPPAGHNHHHHPPGVMRSFGSPQHQPAATVMPRSMHRDHYQPITQHDLEVRFADEPIKSVVLQGFSYQMYINDTMGFYPQWLNTIVLWLGNYESTKSCTGTRK